MPIDNSDLDELLVAGKKGKPVVPSCAIVRREDPGGWYLAACFVSVWMIGVAVGALIKGGVPVG